MPNKITAYEGTEGYVFISYAHKDTDQVFPIMEQLHNRGYRIWYDDGIAPGSEWPEDIARHLNGSSMAIAFVSPNSMASVNCRREINFALSKEIPFLSVILEPTEMPLGMELQLSAQQSVIRYNYRTEEQFIEKICACPDLARCQTPPKQPEPVAVAEPFVEAPKPAVETLKPAVETLKPPVVDVPGKDAEKPGQEPQPKPVKAPPSKPSGKLLGMIAAAVAVVAVVLVLLFALPGKDNPEPSVESTAASTVQTEPAETEPPKTEPAKIEPAPTEKEEEIIFHIKVPDNWEKPTMWPMDSSGSGRSYCTWPGISLKKDADGWYTGTAPAWVRQVSICGNDGECESEPVDISKGEEEVWIIVRNNWSCQISYDGPFEATITIYGRIKDWTKPHCTAWNGKGDVYEGDMIKSGDWYTFEVPCDVIGFQITDIDSGYYTDKESVEPGWDIWFEERYWSYFWDYKEYSDEELEGMFGAK